MSQASDWGLHPTGPGNGAQVAARANESFDALLSMHKGPALPDYATAGMIWLDDAVADAWVARLFDGTDLIPLWTYNPTTNKFTKIDALPAGSVLQFRSSAYTANADLPVAIPVDNTVPLSTEGTQVASLSLTPESTANLVELSFTGMGSMSAVGGLTVAIFRGTTCIQAKTITVRNAGDGYPIDIAAFTDAPATTSPVTYSARVGPTTGVARLNGSTTTPWFGGAAKAQLIAKEIKG